MTGRALRRRPTGLSQEQRTIAWQSASLLLGYPEEELIARVPLVFEGSHGLPESVGAPLRATARLLGSTPLARLQEEYVETFDSRRRHTLFLTYFAHGDTRKRGLALLRFKQTYLRSGFVLETQDGDGGELPDHLCVVLEYAATVDQERGERLLLDHRAGLELLRLSLDEAGSPWAGAVAAVTATLPPLEGDEWDAIRRLAAQGPPEEEVGLTPYATPGFEPGPAAPEASTMLPTPTFPGAR